MVSHNKITFAKEYCLCRRIPYKFYGETLVIGTGDKWGDKFSIFSVYNFTYADLIKTIDDNVEYDAENTYFVRVNVHMKEYDY